MAVRPIVDDGLPTMRGVLHDVLTMQHVRVQDLMSTDTTLASVAGEARTASRDRIRYGDRSRNRNIQRAVRGARRALECDARIALTSDAFPETPLVNGETEREGETVDVVLDVAGMATWIVFSSPCEPIVPTGVLGTTA